MESETRNQIDNDYTKFFYATMCHVCKRFGDGVPLKLCSNCKMISYCGQEHQKQHWKQHKPLCKAIQDVLQNCNMNVCGETSEECTNVKQMFILLVSSTLARRLTMDETQMFRFPRECLVCHERDARSLKDCQKCAASFCKDHKDGTEHGDICAPLELCLHSDFLATRKESYYLVLISYATHVFATGNVTFRDMKDFINFCGIIQTDSVMSYDILAADHSQYLTRPLTLFHAMRLLNYAAKRKNLVVHVVGASVAEECTLIGWEVLPRLIETVMSVTIVMIGPELKRKFDPSGTCDDCPSPDNKSLIFKYHDVLYENYVRSSLFVKPDLIVGFNLGIHERELGSKRETWAPSIRMLAKQNCPFVLTSVTLQDFEKETDRINAILGRQVDYIYKEKNPFASLRPHRILGPERVYYENQYVAVYRNLCS
ncbi:uncharacterized protein [Temnothorax nylanderi]|uniref:uncharacterized protein n=1 Tax=Temnothorax nylanderi TaxID=102681 RepID=UPI003A8B430C